MFNLFKKAKSAGEIQKLRDDLASIRAERELLLNEQVDLKNEVKQLKLAKKIEEEDIAHMMKMKEEAMEVKQQKFEMECEKKRDADIAAVKDTYRDKLEEFLQTQVKDMKGMYSDILSRLPNINVKLSGSA